MAKVLDILACAKNVQKKRNRIKNYKLILTTQSPIYIGSGNKISKKEYTEENIKRLHWINKRIDEMLFIPEYLLVVI